MFFSFLTFADYRVIQVKNLDKIKLEETEKIVLIQNVYNQQENGDLKISFYRVIIEGEEKDRESEK